LLWCNSTIDQQVSALEALIRADESGTITDTRLDDAFKRQHDVKARMRPGTLRVPIPLAVIGCEEHQLVATEMATFL
jgi:hypothetical protein